MNPKDSPQKTGTCHNCGKPGHWARECPEPKKVKGFNKPKGDGKNNSRRAGWKYEPPKPGQPQSKEMHNKKFQWCGKCKRWTTTHNTETHQGGQQAAARANLVLEDPAVWHVDIESDWTLADIFILISPLLFSFACGILSAVLWDYSEVWLTYARLLVDCLQAHWTSLTAIVLWLASLLAAYICRPEEKPPHWSRKDRRFHRSLPSENHTT